MDAEELRKKLHPEAGKKSLKETYNKYSTAINIAIAVIFIIALFSVFAMWQTPKKTIGPPTACFKHDICTKLVFATTPEEQEIGLSNHTALPEGTAMLFIFHKSDVQAMWMKDMSFSIDIFWITEKGKIVHIEKNAQPCTPPMCEIYEPPILVKYVLETNAGFAKEANLYDGDKVEFSNLPK
ncbi:DUF192 domain-containing protein [Candidatus Woesearchaeota archaeon]|jgi:uncharacterized membrane protein (UPF0127 family)|nr:DUF192 domain-containing protein [Candidatus Woesearchaeota archaeon]